MAKRGVFISFEGIDGSGKTTQLQLLKRKLIDQGRAVVEAQEPGGTRVGAEIRKLLLDAANTDLRPLPELLLYFASRAQNIDEIILPALEAGKVVVADRFTDATVAYQGYGRGLGVETVRAVEQVACRGVAPDLTLLLDIDPRTGVSRALARNAREAGNDAAASDESRMENESLEFFERIHRGYRELSQAEPERIRTIDASRTIDEIAADVDSIVGEFLQRRLGDPAR